MSPPAQPPHPPPSPAPPALPALEDVLRALARRGLCEVEIFAKHGRSRRLERTEATETSAFVRERAWALRAGDTRGSFFAGGTGEPRPEGPWPEPSGRPLALPPAEPARWGQPAELDAPLVGESEGLRLLASLGSELDAALPGTRLLRAALEDGWSEGELASSRGVRARTRHRVASLHVEARGPGRGAPVALLYLAAREARRFDPRALARRLAVRLEVAAAPPSEPGETPEILLAPPVVARLLAGLAPLLVGPQAVSRGAGFRDRHGRMASELATIVDDGRFPGGVFECGVDGEGVPSREVVLVEAGIFRQPLLTWKDAERATGTPSGCSRRPSWRDLPAPGPTHLYLRPEPRVGVAALVGAVRRGAYALDIGGAGRLALDWETGRFALPVCGFRLEAGRATSPLNGVCLTGDVPALLRGIAGVGRDLTFHLLDGMIGAPTVLATGLEMRRMS
jgi:predicted Zn-dependent protease